MAQTTEQMLKQLTRSVNTLLLKLNEQGTKLAAIESAMSEASPRITVKNASLLMGCSVDKIYKMIDRGDITTAVKQNGCTRISYKEIEKYVPVKL